MPFRHVRLTPEELEYVSNSVESGRFAHAGELVQAALKALRREERVRQELAAAELLRGDEVTRPALRPISTKREFVLPERRRQWMMPAVRSNNAPF